MTTPQGDPELDRRERRHHHCGDQGETGCRTRHGAGVGTVWSFLDRCGLTFKKDHTRHRAGPIGYQEPREAWFNGQLELDPERLNFIDETWASTNMAGSCGRAMKGGRLRSGLPHGHWKTTTFVAGLRKTDIAAPFVLGRPIDRNAFETYVAKVLVPELATGDIVVMDNLSSHKGPRMRETIEEAGARLLYLPPYSPDFNTIEIAFSKLKALLDKAAERTIPALWGAMGHLIDLITPQDAANFVAAAGYEPD